MPSLGVQLLDMEGKEGFKSFQTTTAQLPTQMFTKGIWAEKGAFWGRCTTVKKESFAFLGSPTPPHTSKGTMAGSQP